MTQNLRYFVKVSVFVLLLFFLFPLLSPVYAQSGPLEVTQYVTNTLQIITLIASAAAVFFLIKGGYTYITSTGNPKAVVDAKKTIRSAMIGLILVLAAGVIVSVFQNALSGPNNSTSVSTITMAQLEAVEPEGGLTQVLIEAVTGFLQNLVESATAPIVDSVLGFLTTTPSLMQNSIIVNFWMISLAIVDALFVLVVALLGLQVMSASTLGFEEVELKQILPKLGLAFLGANISLFLTDYVILTCNTLTQAILDSTGGLNHAWVVNAVNPTAFLTGTTPLITLLFLIIFLIVSIVLLLMYISRLIVISLSAVLAPFIFLLWVIPKFSDFAEISIKSYFVTVFMIFVHVVIIQLAASYLALPEQSNNSLMSIAVAIGLFFTLLKTPSTMMQLVMYTSRNGTVKKLGSQLINVISTNQSKSALVSSSRTIRKLPRKVIHA